MWSFPTIVTRRSRNYGKMRAWKLYQSRSSDSESARTELVEDYFIVTEKIHGAHLKIEAMRLDESSSELTLRACSRRNILNLKEPHFFNVETAVLPHIKAALFHLFWVLSMFHDKLWSVSVFGEIFGGRYGHKNVSPASNVRPVQTKFAHYTPDIHFLAFDVQCTRRDNTSFYVPFHQTLTLLRAVGIASVPVVLTGTYEDVCAFDLEHFCTRVPALYGLPPIHSNLAEGVVIRLAHDTQKYRGHRICFKWKNSNFEEVSPNIYKHMRVKVFDDGVCKSTLFRYQPYFTEHRLAAVLSKLDEVERKNKAKVCGLFVRDVLEDAHDGSIFPRALKKKLYPKLLASARTVYDLYTCDSS